MRPDDYLRAARCPETTPTGENGLWKLERVPAVAARNEVERRRIGNAPYITILSRWTDKTIHLNRGEVVMEDSPAELRRHMPIWLNARGRVLVTGLGLGCVVRGLLSNPNVEHITVVELDGKIIEWIWPEFIADERLMLLQGNAFDMAWPPGTRFDFAWHDIFDEGTHEAVLHAKLMIRYIDMADAQGGWGMPRWWRRRVGGDFLKGRKAA